MDEGEIMSMTKSEKAILDAALKHLAMERSMRRSNKVKRDLPPPTNGFTHGWDFNAYNNGTVHKSTSSSLLHCDGEWRTERGNGGWSQNSLTMFSTELRAYQALRHEMAEKFAEILSRIDARIEELEAPERKG